MSAAATLSAKERGEALKRENIVIRTYDLWKTYVMGDQEIHAVRGVEIEIKRGEYVAIMGPSGSGKSTLMNLIGCLDTPTKGDYFINGHLVSAMTDAGYLGALIPEEYGGSGLSLCHAVAILETVHSNGGNGSACHAQMYVMGIILRHGSEAQKRKWLPKIASGQLRLQAFGVTEPTAGGV